MTDLEREDFNTYYSGVLKDALDSYKRRLRHFASLTFVAGVIIGAILGFWGAL